MTTDREPPVEQRHRDAASAAYYDCFDSPPNALWMAKMENGGHDDDALVQAFARFDHDRTAALVEALEKIEHKAIYGSDWNKHRGDTHYFAEIIQIARDALNTGRKA